MKPQYREPKEKRNVASFRVEDSLKKKIKSKFKTLQAFIDAAIQKEFYDKR